MFLEKIREVDGGCYHELIVHGPGIETSPPPTPPGMGGFLKIMIFG